MNATSHRLSSPSLSSAIRPSNFEAAMLAAQHWVVCEQSGRWSAGLRVAFGRLPGAGSSLRLLEVRTLRELLAHSDDRPCDLSLIEVGPENLTEILQLLVRRDPRL